MYDRQKAVEYAKRWAMGRNPVYYDFEHIGGDCTNFVSQCLYVGCGEMNYSTDGWYYNSLSDRAPAWTGVEFLGRFLLSNKGMGVKGEVIPLSMAKQGVIVQLYDGARYYHTAIITGLVPILVCAHSVDVRDGRLDGYECEGVRCIGIY